MTTTKDFIRTHPLVTYFILTCAISWGFVLMSIGPDGILGVKEISENLMPVVYMATLLGPSVAGVLLTGLMDGRAGFRELRSRLLTWRIGARWYAVALLTAPLLITATLLALSLTDPAFLPAIVTRDEKVILLLMGIVMGLVVGFFEELGWTGFAVPRLRQRHSVITTGIVVGLLWGVWHFPLFLGNSLSAGALSPVLYLCVLLFSFLPAYRVLMVWVYDRTESLLVVILMHAPLAASQLILIPLTMSGVQIVTYDLAFAATLWIFIAVVAVIDRGQLENRVNRLPGHSSESF